MGGWEKFVLSSQDLSRLSRWKNVMFLGNCKQLDITRPKGSEIAGGEASEPGGVSLAKLRI